MLKSPIYLIPFDFTKMSINALSVGINLAKSNDGSIYLIHVVKKESEKIEAQSQLDSFVSGLNIEKEIKVTSKVMAGDLFDEVGRAGDILNAKLSIMGTHGATGLQKVFGSKALKMVAKSNVPFLVTIKEAPLEFIETIVMPFSFVKESLHVLSYVTDIAKEYKSIIHLVGYHDKKEWLKEQSLENQAIAKKALAKEGVACEIVNLPKEKSYEDELSDYMYKVRADLIATAYFKNGVLPPPNSFVQVMLDNDHEIPVLTINANSNS